VSPERPLSTSERRRSPRAVTYPYRRIEPVEVTPADGPDPSGDEAPAGLGVAWQQLLHTIEIGGARINYAAIGTGPAIVFVHGLGGCWQNWLENMPRMAELGYRAIALDLPGFGSSPMPPWPISIPNYGQLLGDFREALDLGTCTLVGNSMGGFIAAEVAVGEPEWVDRLVLVSSAGISHATMRRGLRKLALGGVMRHPDRMPREILVEFIAPALGAPGFVPAVAALTGYDLLDRLERIRVPTLVVWGRDDLVVPAADAAGFLQRIPGAELVVFDDCGHVPMAEHPTRFNRLLARFCETDHA
jgi:pimeloyl-ACP methyl ester carboxylesterase